jgi:hypothetical protein
MKRLLFLPLMLLCVSVSMAGPHATHVRPAKASVIKNSSSCPPVYIGGGSLAITSVGGGIVLAGVNSSSGVTNVILQSSISKGSFNTGASFTVIATGASLANSISTGGYAIAKLFPVNNSSTLTISSDMVNLNGDLSGNNPSNFAHVVIMNPNPGGNAMVSISGNSFYTSRGTLSSTVPFTVNGAAYSAGSYSLPLYQSATIAGVITGSEVPILN